MKTRVFVVLAVGLVTMLTAAPNALAAEPVGKAAPTATNPFVGVPATGTVTSLTGLLTPVASLDVRRFANQNGQLVAIAAVKDAAGNVLATLPIPVDLARSRGGASAYMQGSCRILHLELGPLDLNLLGLRIQLNRVILDITAERGPGNLLGNLLCAIANLLNPPTPALDALVARLNRLLAILSGGPLTGVPATGAVTNTATGAVSQIASLDVRRFAVQNGQLVAITALRDAAGRVLATAPIPVDLAATRVGSSAVYLQATCRILHLELGPLDLNLLGLRIQLNRVILDITAESGPGNLLGNLLCAIANLLNPPALTGLANRLNRLLQLVASSPLAAIPAAGSVTRRGTATQVTTLDVQRFVTRNGRLFAVGALRDAAGRALATTRIPVNLRQSSGSCRILHLDLGPLDLNLLGLRIQLSRVILDITAEPGAGNLLGNLLCAIARLLDRTPLRATPALANRLNQTLAFYRP